MSNRNVLVVRSINHVLETVFRAQAEGVCWNEIFERGS